MCKSEIHSDPQQNDAPDGEVVTNVRRSVLWIAISVAAIALALNFAAKATIKMATAPIETQNFTKGRDYPFFSEFGQLIAWWDPMPDEHHSNVAAVNTSANKSNIHPGDYAGPESCRECHARNYESWSTHSHRYMNAYANESTVKGDFSGNATINYFGGLGEFYREGGEYRMRLTREDILRVYTINQTIGSRFTQYYVGKMTQGPEPTDHDFYKTDHVLPFGYWMDERKWIPIVHVHEVFDDDKQLASDEDLWPSDQRLDPFSEPGFVPYTRCADCHTTFPLADSMIRAPGAIGLHLPNKVHFSMSDYLRAEHPDVWKSDKDPSDFLHSEFNDMTDLTRSWEAPDRAVSLGITCEACHMGSKAHVKDKHEKPDFFIKSPHLHLEGAAEKDFGRTQANVNYMCGRCHVGSRPELAGGISTWNSTEFSDASRGSCYSELKCIDCHDAHAGIGKKWKLTPTQDDQSCIRCHDQFADPKAIQAHTHHQPDTAGAHCMDCHMPRMNEGLQDLVRTHTIFSPTDPAMIEKNHPNACNMCHPKKAIDWTLAHLEDWYGKTYSKERLSKYYPNREGPVAKNWLGNKNSSVRLIAADSLLRTKSLWAIEDLINALDDPFLINRQFAGSGLEQMLDINLEDFGYQFYKRSDERSDSLEKLRLEVLGGQPIKGGQPIEETSRPPRGVDGDSE